MHSGIAKRVAAAVLIGLLAFAGPAAKLAMADTSEEIQARLDEAKAELYDLYRQAELASEDLNHTRVLLGETEDQIEQVQTEIVEKQEELAQAKLVLSERISSNYKTGGVTILSIILESSNFSELVSNMYYAGKIARSDAEAIEAVKLLKAELGEKEEELSGKKQEQEELLAQQEEQIAELDRRTAVAEDYVANLDQELQDKLEEERIAAEEAARKAAEEEAARRAAEEAARKAAEEEAAARAAEQNEDQPEQDGQDQDQESPAETPQAPEEGGSSGDEAWRSVVIAAAYSKLGSSYVSGGSGPSSFDCSGFTAWCYAQAGIYISHSSGSQAGYCNKPASQAQPGDIVWFPGHVGIYIGNGQTIEAFNPSMGVRFGSLYGNQYGTPAFQSAGSPVG